MKRITVVLIFLLLLSTFPIVPISKVYAIGENWLTGWDYRKSHTIIHSSGAGTNYQIKFRVNFGSGTDYGWDVYLNSHSQTDFSDVRFTRSDGNTELDYFREKHTASDFAWFWVEIAADLSSSDVTIYIYWGKSGTLTTSNIKNTMCWGSDFEDGNLNDWDTKTGWSLGGSDPIQYTWYAQATTVDRLGKEHNIEYEHGYTSKAMEFYWQQPSNISWHWMSFLERYRASPLQQVYVYAEGGYIKYFSGNNPYSLFSGLTQTWYKVRIKCYTSYWNVAIYSADMDVEKAAANGLSYNNWFDPPYDIDFDADDKTQLADCYFVRKWIPTEPSYGSWGALELAEGFYYNVDFDMGEWVFANWKFYTFNVTATVPVGISAWDFVRVSFLDQAEHNCTIFYDYSNNDFTIYNESSDENERYIRIRQNNDTVSSGRTFYIPFEIWFTENIVDTYIDKIDLYFWGNYTGGTLADTFSNLFYIYNRGGFSLNYETSSAAAYRISGGDVFEFYCQSSAAPTGTEYVYADAIWRNLQHIKQLFQIQARVAYPAFRCEYGIDYYTVADGWIYGWELQLTAINITVPRVSGSEAYWCWKAEWFFNQTSIKTDYIFSFPQGNPLADGNYASSRLWLDFWFNQINASSTWGGRVNAYYYPVKDNADAWLRVLSTNWGADDKRQKESLCFGTLRHNDGSVCLTQEIIMVKAWSRLRVWNDDTYTQKVTQFFADVQDLTLGRVPLIGIQTPAFDETKMPTLQSGGFLGMLFPGFSWIGKWLADNIVWGGLNLWGNFVGFLDTIAALFGQPKFFTNLFTAISDFIGWLADGLLYAWQLAVQIFLLIASLLGAFVNILVQLVSSIGTTITTFQDMMSGAIGAGGSVWNSLGLTSWITVALVFYPLYLIFLWEEQGLDPVIQQLTWIFGIVSWLFNFFIQIVQFVIGMVTSIIESIPIAE